MSENQNISRGERTMQYEPMAGEHISRAAETMVQLATDTGETVTAEFNDIPLVVKPGDQHEDIVTRWQNEMNRRREEYRASPEYRERQRQAEEKQRRKEQALRDGLRDAGPLKIINSDTWENLKKNNTDPYSKACVDYAEKWGRLMQVRLAKGEALDQCAKETSHIAADEGITGFMYGCAVSMLAECWESGEQLRRWHNLDTQIGTEGEEANKSGGVLNPALLNVDVKP